MKQVLHRLRRVAGQIDGLESAIAAGEPCENVIPQLLAVKGALNGALQVYLEESLENCVDCNDPQKMKAVMKVLVKNT